MAAHQAPPSMGFSRQKYWSGVPLPSLDKDLMRTQIHKWSLFISQATTAMCPTQTRKLQIDCSLFPYHHLRNHNSFIHLLIGHLVLCQAWSLHVCVFSCFSCVQLFVTPLTVAHQAPLSVGFSRQVYWSGLPYPPPGDLPHPGSKPGSPASAGRFFTTNATWEAQVAQAWSLGTSNRGENETGAVLASWNL